MIHRSVVAGLLLVAAVCTLPAQEKKEPEQRDVKVAPVHTEEAKAPLPKIENPEFVITGQEAIDLPEAAKNDAAEASTFVPPLPSSGAKASDIARTASKLSLRSNQAGMNGKVYGAFGNYITPSIGAWFGQSYPEGSVAVNARFASSDGYIRNTQTQSAGFGVAGSYKLPASGDFLSESRWKAELGFGGEQYRAFASPEPELRRTRNDLDFGVGFDSRYAWTHPSFTPIDYSTRLSWTRTSLGDSAKGIENEIALSTQASSTFEGVPVRASFEYRLADESMPLGITHTMHWAALSGEGRVMAAKNVQFNLGASLTMFRGNETPYGMRLYPRATLRYFAAQWLTLRAGFEPSVSRTSLRSVLNLNKYVLNTVALRPADSPMQVSAGFDCIPMSDAAFSVNVDYRHIDNYLSFSDVTLPFSWSRNILLYSPLPYPLPSMTNVWTAYYLSDVRALKTEVRASYVVSPVGTVTGMFTYNSTTHKDSTTQLPFVPSVSAGLVYRHAFQSNVSAEVTGEYIGKRFMDFTATKRNAGYVVFGAKCEYGIAGNLRLSGEIQNLLNQKYYIWNGYRERPLFVSVGISYLW